MSELKKKALGHPGKKHLEDSMWTRLCPLCKALLRKLKLSIPFGVAVAGSGKPTGNRS